MIKRLALFTVSLALALLAAEGALSFFTRRTLAELWWPPQFMTHPQGQSGLIATGAARAGETAPSAGASPSGASDGASAGGESADPLATDPGGAAAALIGQIYTAHDDPLVSYVLKPDTDQKIFESHVLSDHLGMRRRPGPPAPDDALRVVVLGDSIAFGFGVGDDQTLAARLEARLAELRGGRERPVSCRTIAIPSWNHRAEFAFLVDHWDELRPDLVLCLPCKNDVFDLDGAFAAGARRVQPDPASADPWLTVSVRYMLQTEGQKLLVGRGGSLTEEELGADAIFSDLCAESVRRHDENAQGIADMQRWLAQRRCALALVWFVQDDYTWFLSTRLGRLAPELPMIPLLKWMRSEFTLGRDPHPNAETLDVWAGWLAQELVDRGLVSRGAGPAPAAAPGPYAELRAEMPEAGEWESLAHKSHERWRKRLRPEIDLVSGRGLLQVFGGLNLERTARSRLLAILDPQGPQLELDLAPLAERPDLYPLEVGVEANGVSLGTVTIPSDAPLHARLPLPAGLDRSRPLEVRLSPRHWVVIGQPGHAEIGRLLVSSFRPLRLACLPEGGAR